MNVKPMFEVDRQGLAQILARRGVEFAVLELIQNALDESGVTRVIIHMHPSDVRGHHVITVADDAPEGFADIRHAYTLFASSKKKDNPEQRGRFNLGEKLVIACSRTARITTTTGSVIFRGSERTSGRDRTGTGSIVEVEIKMNQGEVAATTAAIRSVLCPATIGLSLNGEHLPARQPLHSVIVNLPTERSDGEGYLRPTKRDTSLAVYAPLAGETPTLYEIGIPVVALDCAWHVDIAQKVPLNMDRDNITPAYRRAVLTAVVNLMHKDLPADAAAAPWVGEALTSLDLAPEAVNSVLTARYGERRVIADPSDPEGTKIAVTRGYQVIQAGSFSKGQWESIRRSGAALPAGQVTPSPKPFHPGGAPLKTIVEWHEGHRAFVGYAKAVARELLDTHVEVVLADDPSWNFGGAYGPGCLTVNVRNRRGWFQVLSGHFLEIDRFLIHEFAHHRVRDHLSSEFHEECCRLGSRLAQAVRRGAFAEYSDGR